VIQSKPIVAIIGRPNVGKSTLFNRILRKKMAIVDDQPGITRDRLYGNADWSGREFHLVDTGGLVLSEKENLVVAVGDQARLAIEEADVVLFLVDMQVSPTLEDGQIADVLHRASKKVILVLNKADSSGAEENETLYLNLGLGSGIAVSSLHGRNIGELLDEVVKRLPQWQDPGAHPEGIQVAVLGRPNVGKSSLVNAIVGEDRVIVDKVPGTTRDAVDTVLHMDDETFVFIDTAGLRRKSKIKGSVEFYSSIRTLRGLDRCQVALLVLDADSGPTAQDLKIARQIHDAYKGIVLVLNKWDLIQSEGALATEYENQVKKRYPSLSFVPVVAASALTGMHISRVLDQVRKVHQERGKRISTSLLNKFVAATVERRHPPSVRGRQTKIYYVTQQRVHPPTFVFFANYPSALTAPYKRYLNRQLRESFGFQGVPLRIWIRKRGGPGR